MDASGASVEIAAAHKFVITDGNVVGAKTAVDHRSVRTSASAVSVKIVVGIIYVCMADTAVRAESVGVI